LTVGACGESGGSRVSHQAGVEDGSPRSGTKWIKRIRRIRRRFEAGRRTDTRRARASATLRPKLMEAADMERAAMVSRLRTTAALKRIGRWEWYATLFQP
jgi:hypothetical protein